MGFGLYIPAVPWNRIAAAACPGRRDGPTFLCMPFSNSAPARHRGCRQLTQLDSRRAGGEPDRAYRRDPGVCALRVEAGLPHAGRRAEEGP